MPEGTNVSVSPNHSTNVVFDVEQVRRDFPILSRQVHGHDLVYLDSGASAQKPRQVIDCMRRVYEETYSNVHRGVHFLSQTSTDHYEAVRGKVSQFIGAGDEHTIVFTRGGTESINLVAQSYARVHLKAGDEVIISTLEHHANIVPWQLLREQIGIDLKVVPIDDAGNFLFDEFTALLGPRTRLVAVAHVSNVLGTVMPIAEITAAAHDAGAVVMVDGCQGVTHLPLDVRALDVDFYAFTGHKLYGPNAIGILYGKAELLDKMAPYQGGGDMIETVSFEKTTFKAPPFRFEAGTPPIVEGIGLGAAIDYVSDLGMDAIAEHEHELKDYAHQRLADIPHIRFIGTADNKTSIVSFVFDDIHAHDIGTIVDRMGVAVRVGHHCAEPLMDRFGIAGSARASFGMYNTKDEVDRLRDALLYARSFFS